MGDCHARHPCRSCRSLSIAWWWAATRPTMVCFCSHPPPYDLGGVDAAKAIAVSPAARSFFSPSPPPPPPPCGEGGAEGGRGEGQHDGHAQPHWLGLPRSRWSLRTDTQLRGYPAS